MQHRILSAIGTDRPGLVDEVSQVAYDLGINIADSRMVNLRGQFAIMMLLEASESSLGRLDQMLPELAESSGLHLELRAAGDSDARRGDARAFILKASAIDQPGLVHRISHVLREHKVNIESLESTLQPAPYTGAPLFEMQITLAISAQTSIAELRESVGSLCDELNVDWSLAAV